eukprot:9496808-Pyramimonas_sp.AAC.1
MASLGVWFAISASLFSVTPILAVKRVRTRPAAPGPPVRPTFELARVWARSRSDSWAARGITTNFADADADYSVYRELFRE